jgi:hypothetical protein
MCNRRPEFNINGTCIFNGKIRIWLLLKREQAKRTSNNRVKVTWETQCINVSYDIYLDCMLEKVLPALKAEFPRAPNRIIHIGIQQDNAPSHFTSNVAMWTAAIKHEVAGVWHFCLLEQPPKSTDTNTLGLGFLP